MATQPAGGVEGALLFVPDISGFTQFVQSTEITHSQHIIEELLAKLIDANEIGLEVSEVEGDAILFYRFGERPAADALFQQVQRMFLGFHSQLKLFESQRICDCGACATAYGLTLKVVAHYGPITKSRIKDHVKLFGQDVITVHRLLKNDIPHHEYALFTNALAGGWPQQAAPVWGSMEQAAQAYDVGEVAYRHVSLAPLRELVPKPAPEDFGIQGPKALMFSCEQRIAAPMGVVAGVATNLPLRLHWMQGAQKVEMLNDQVNRLGTKHRCIIDKDSPVMVTSGFARSDDVITLTETDEKKVVCTVCTIRAEGERQTHVKIDGYVKDAFPVKMIVGLLAKKKLTACFDASVANLKRYCEDEYRQQPA
jgi:hypothetical protein